MNGLRDQGFEVGDQVYRFDRGIKARDIRTLYGPMEGKGPFVVFTEPDWNDCGFPRAVDAYGVMTEDYPTLQSIFHRDAITFDEYGRLTAINHDYVKPRPKIVTQLDYDFQPFEQVLLRDSNDQPWRKDLFDKRTDAHKPYVGLILGKGWSQCIPFAGNEKLDGVVTK